MVKVIAIANQKGGVGKTTTSVNLSAALADLGKRVLIVDLDPQGNSSSGLGIEKSALRSSLYEVLYSRKYSKCIEVELIVKLLYKLSRGPRESFFDDPVGQHNEALLFHLNG